MWAVIYMGHNKHDAENIKNALEKEGILVKVRKIGSDEDPVYEILVPKEEVKDAHDVLSETVY